jgi:outer membrane protein assembly factor BamB
MSWWRRLRVTGPVAALVAGGTALALGTPVAASAGGTADPDASVAYQHDAAHDGDSTDPWFVAPFARSWSVTLPGEVGYPLIVDGRVFVTVAHSPGYGNDVEALSLATGDVLWGPVSIGGTYATGRIAYDEGRVFAINHDGELTAFDASTGTVAWTSQLAGQYSFTSAPTAVGGTLYVGGAGSGGTLYAVDEATGTTTWTAPVMNGDSSSPAVDADGVYVSYACEQAYRFDLAGALVWHHDTDCEGGGGRTPVLHDGRVYIRDDAGKTPAVLDASSGDQVASYAAGPAPAFDGHHMATVSAGVLTVSDTASGDPLWHAGTDAVTAPLIANGYVIEGHANGLVEARHIQDGELVWSGFAGDVLAPPDEHNAGTLTGLAEGDGALVVPAGSTLTVFVPAVDTVAPSVRLFPFRQAVIHHPETTAFWTATDAMSGVAVSQVRVRRGHLGEPLSAWVRQTPTTAHRATVDLRRRTRLCLAVRARDRVGNWSAWPSAQCVTRRP